jgi:hypothetical protein
MAGTNPSPVGAGAGAHAVPQMQPLTEELPSMEALLLETKSKNHSVAKLLATFMKIYMKNHGDAQALLDLY